MQKEWPSCYMLKGLECLLKNMLMQRLLSNCLLKLNHGAGTMLTQWSRTTLKGKSKELMTQHR
eukprot:6413628-Karenia_brevis.AAC.1